MPQRPAGGSLITVLACSLFLVGCTSTPEPLPAQPTTEVKTPPAPTARSSTTGPPAAPTLAPAPVPTESDAVTPAFQELRATLELFSREKLEDGASAVLIKAKVGQQVWTLAEGVRSRDGRVPVQPGDRFPVGEQYRSFLAVSVMKLVEGGRLGLADPVAAYLPGSLTAGSSVTIRELLGDARDVPAAVRSNAGSLLTRVVEQLRGAPLEAVLRTDVLTPLNLRSTPRCSGAT